ncbi:MAG: hypothetical protein GXY52_03840 [Chloroflexi bacterium]|nr:hypothetical protein [Chloroflexota bacterium]
MNDGTRRIFWLDILLVLLMAALAITGQWDWVLAALIGTLMLNIIMLLRLRK